MANPIYSRWNVYVFHGDCLDVLRAMPDASVSSLVTDPPAGIAFMSRDWDSDRGGRDAWVGWLAERMREALRVLTPGAHALIWALPRTSHWTAWALQDAGFEIRDCITHLFGTGFPKSLDVSKAIDRLACAEREVIGQRSTNAHPISDAWILSATEKSSVAFGSGRGQIVDVTVPATDAAQQWDGWGTALKPSGEHWWLVRKPFRGAVASNVLEHGTGALNIDACRVAWATSSERAEVNQRSGPNSRWWGGVTEKSVALGDKMPNAMEDKTHAAGRWPCNVVLSHAALQDPVTGEAIGDACAHGCVDGCPVRELDTQSGLLTTHGGGTRKKDPRQIFGGLKSQPDVAIPQGDSGGASRFFPVFRWEAKAPASERPRVNGTAHPTVKSLGLMRWLVRLVTPPGGMVLDCFAGTGTTGQAARAEGFPAILIESDIGAIPLIRARLDALPSSDAPPAGESPADAAAPVDLFSADGAP